MGLLNYTTKVDADKTAMEIARCLSMHGASAVLTEYDEKEGTVTAISFKIKLNGQEMGFRLPCDWRPVQEIFQKERPIEKGWNDEKYQHKLSEQRMQAVRTAWRIVKDWVEAQMALVETKMVTTAEVFLPYVVMRDGRTLAQHAQSNPSFLLGDGE